MSSRVEFQVLGRSGNLIYTEGRRQAKAYVEMSGSKDFDMLVDIDGMNTWSTGEIISEIDLAKIREEFYSWSRKSKYRCQW